VLTPALPRAYFRYLVRRLGDSLRRARPGSQDLEWVASVLQPGELALWRRLSDFDQYHSVRVARWAERGLLATEHAGEGRWLAAALLHDVGKLEAGLGPAGRVVADLAGRVASLTTAHRWAASPNGLLRRIGLHLTHGPAGARAIRAAGGREVVAAWAEAHQSLPCPQAPGVPEAVAAVLSEADLQ
jgi:hypothetical protein